MKPVEGVCVTIRRAPLGGHQRIRLMDESGTAHDLLLDRRQRFLIGSSYRVYLQSPPGAALPEARIEGVGDAHWENVSSNGEIQPWDGEKTFLGVLIKRDDKYVGYATIMIERPENNWRYNATIINCKELSPEERSNSEIMPEDLYKMIDSAIESAK